MSPLAVLTKYCFCSKEIFTHYVGEYHLFESGGHEGSVDGVVANRDYALTSIVLEVAFDLAWPPMLLPPKLEYELRGLLRVFQKQ
jgi:hypothetical protein